MTPFQNPFLETVRPCGRRFAALVVAVVAAGTVPDVSRAANGDCGIPVSSGDLPKAADALRILQTAVGTTDCSPIHPECICDVNDSGSVSASDALLDLQAAVGLDIVLDCGDGCVPPSTTTTTMPGGYAPVSFSDASDEAVARLDEVLADLGELFEGGASFPDLVDFLETEPDVEGVHFNGATIYFRVAGIPTSAHDGYGTRIADGAGAQAMPSPRKARNTDIPTIDLLPGGEAETSPPMGQRVVGRDADRENAKDLTKSAVVLAPYLFQFGEYDSATYVADTLESLPDYTQVDRFFNATGGIANSLRIADWIRDWTDYDIVFISTHGNADPASHYGPQPVLSLGVFAQTCTDLRTEMFAELLYVDHQNTLFCGWTNASSSDDDPDWQIGVVATPDFFGSIKNQQMNKKVVYVDACRSGRGDGLANALTGTDSVFFGWDDYVNSGVSTNVANAILEEAAGNGFPIWRSFVRTCAEGGCIEPFPATPPNTKKAELLVHHDRADLRIREGLILSGDPLVSNCTEVPMFPVSQTCPACVGMQPAAGIVFDVDMEGVTDEDLVLRQDPNEFAVEQYRLWGDVDDVEQPYALPIWSGTATKIGDGRVEMPFATLFMEDVCPGEVVEYRPKVLLPAFDPILTGKDSRDWLYSIEDPFLVTIEPPGP